MIIVELRYTMRRKPHIAITNLTKTKKGDREMRKRLATLLAILVGGAFGFNDQIINLE